MSNLRFKTASEPQNITDWKDYHQFAEYVRKTDKALTGLNEILNEVQDIMHPVHSDARFGLSKDSANHSAAIAAIFSRCPSSLNI